MELLPGETRYLVKTKHWHCEIVVNEVSQKIVFAGASLGRFKGSTIKILKKWMEDKELGWDVEKMRE